MINQTSNSQLMTLWTNYMNHRVDGEFKNDSCFINKIYEEKATADQIREKFNETVLRAPIIIKPVILLATAQQDSSSLLYSFPKELINLFTVKLISPQLTVQWEELQKAYPLFRQLIDLRESEQRVEELPSDAPGKEFLDMENLVKNACLVEAIQLENKRIPNSLKKVLEVRV